MGNLRSTIETISIEAAAPVASPVKVAPRMPMPSGGGSMRMPKAGPPPAPKAQPISTTTVTKFAAPKAAPARVTPGAGRTALKAKKVKESKKKKSAKASKTKACSAMSVTASMDAAIAFAELSAGGPGSGRTPYGTQAKKDVLSLIKHHDKMANYHDKKAQGSEWSKQVAHEGAAKAHSDAADAFRSYRSAGEKDAGAKYNKAVEKSKSAERKSSNIKYGWHH